jgi:hypothetical protein
MLESIHSAVNHVYTVLDYQEKEYQIAFLLYQLGGHAAADIAHKSLGIPSIGTAK